ncbi:MAG: NAD-dependent epimerase/dehydratase family protein [Rhodospirillaceae bacterium]
MAGDRPAAAFGSALVTGGTGFLGGHLVRRLAALGVSVTATVRAGSDPERVTAISDHATVHRLTGDSGDLVECVRHARPDVIFHLAARFASTHVHDDISGMIADNVTFTAELCEAAVAVETPTLIAAGTAWQNAESPRGDPTPAPNTLYAASKQAADDIIDYYARARDLGAITLKIYDSYGPGDPRRKFLTVLADTMANGETMKASPGDQKLHTVHVDDLVDGFVHAGNLLTTGQRSGRHSFTLPSPGAITLRELAQTWARAAGVELSVEWGATPHRPGEVMVPWEGTPLPGWSPRISLENGLRALQV